MTERIRRFKLPGGWVLTVIYERSPIVERWGYRPLVIAFGFIAALFALRVLL
jgi:hypothetical protein